MVINKCLFVLDLELLVNSYNMTLFRNCRELLIFYYRWQYLVKRLNGDPRYMIMFLFLNHIQIVENYNIKIIKLCTNYSTFVFLRFCNPIISQAWYLLTFLLFGIIGLNLIYIKFVTTKRTYNDE